MSASLYDTFGNETSFEVNGGTLIAYLENATINFPLPEAGSQILANLTDKTYKIKDPVKLDMVNSKLIKAGYKKANATALGPVLMQVADAQGIDPLEYFHPTQNTLSLTVDAYGAINTLRPAGSRVGIFTSRVNSKSTAEALIKH